MGFVFNILPDIVLHFSMKFKTFGPKGGSSEPPETLLNPPQKFRINRNHENEKKITSFRIIPETVRIEIITHFIFLGFEILRKLAHAI